MIARLAEGRDARDSGGRDRCDSAAVQGARRVAPFGGSGARPRFELIRVHDDLTTSVRPALLVLTVAVGVVLSSLA